MLTACPFLWGSQDIDFAALYKAYNDELMTWKVVIDERHRGEKKSSGLSHLPPSLLSAPHGWPAPRSFFIATDPAIVMEITLVHWCVLSRHLPQNIPYRAPLPSRLLGASGADANHYVSVSVCSTTVASSFVVAVCSG